MPLMDSPRIRGDGPNLIPEWFFIIKFSPYSRGWSLSLNCQSDTPNILPVFAGMVPLWLAGHLYSIDSPRIRGDGPMNMGRE